MSAFQKVGNPTRASDDRSPLVDFLAKPDQYVPMFDAITRSLEPSDLKTLSRVSQDLRGVYQKTKDTQWNVNTALKKFVTKPEEFRNKLGQNSAFIAGVFAMDFFDRNPVGNSLDLQVHLGEQGDAVEKYLIDEGFTEDIRPGDPPTVFYKTQYFQHCKKTRLWISILQSMDHPLDQVLRGVWGTTAGTVFMTATKAYAPFADMTLKTKKAYCMRPLDYEGRDELSYVKARGYELLDTRFKDRGKTRLRRLNDSSSWIMALDTTHIAPPSTPDYVLEHAEFLVTCSTNRRGPLHYRIMLRELKHAGLAHEWIVAHDWTVAGLGRVEPIARRLDALVFMELCDLPREDLPENWDELQHRKELLQTMTGYKGRLFDEKIPEWLQELNHPLLPSRRKKWVHMLAKLFRRS
ncbi:hypothetical protein BU16DRAFT_532401 [Lophium mytilinum]|uniref:Uncharacterized protein n=1 Tax=Lophium mytilinum TaxID=390894 RepID=A0A6A6RE05_9PEZI|nr:hypothetical protein BU16DRAFT_532401 [Lophium mytilinum]